jgi:hypothetical protein
MRSFFQSILVKMRQLMLGRYGYDELSRCLFILAFAFVILSYIPILRVLYVPALVLLILSCVRCFFQKP